MNSPGSRVARGFCAAMLASLIAFGGAASAGQNAGVRPGRLRILVVEGEGGINIIGQRTAIAPIVEVRDRNDQPVGGVTVTFAIRGGHATLNGARTLTVTTNAAGRATVTGLTSTSSGTFQINASAAYQGQTAQVAIPQTNVMTAVQAAQLATGTGAASGTSAAAGAGAVAGAGAAAAAGAAGGSAAGAGLGTAATLGIIGGAVGGGLLVTRQVLVGGYTDYVGQFRVEIVETSQNGGPFCTSTLALQGTLEMELTEDNGTLGGELVSKYTITEIARTCPNPKGPIDEARRASAVSGTTANVQVNDQWAFNNNGVGSNVIQFSGAVSGDTLTGTWSHAESYTGVPNGNGTVYSATVPLTSVSVTLRKQ